jgi:hypothetical protein
VAFTLNLNAHEEHREECRPEPCAGKGGGAMPGGGGVKIPRACVNAHGVRRPLFNPALRRGEMVVGEPGLEFSPSDMRRVLDTVYPPKPSYYKSRAFLLWVFLWPCMIAPVGYLVRHDPLMPLVVAIALALPLVSVGFYSLLAFVASRTWGIVAFTGEPEPVVDGLLTVGRCPSCAYPLGGQGGADGCRVCTECGAAWRIT